MKDKNKITDPSTVSWKCTSIYDDEDIERIRDVHRMLWSGFVQVEVFWKNENGHPEEIGNEDLIAYYRFTRECETDIGVSMPGCDRVIWIIELEKAPDKILSLNLNENGSTSFQFEKLGWVTFEHSGAIPDMFGDQWKAYHSLKFAAQHFLRDLLK